MTQWIDDLAKEYEITLSPYAGQPYVNVQSLTDYWRVFTDVSERLIKELNTKLGADHRFNGVGLVKSGPIRWDVYTGTDEVTMSAALDQNENQIEITIVDKRKPQTGASGAVVWICPVLSRPGGFCAERDGFEHSAEDFPNYIFQDIFFKQRVRLESSGPHS